MLENFLKRITWITFAIPYDVLTWKVVVLAWKWLNRKLWKWAQGLWKDGGVKKRASCFPIFYDQKLVAVGRVYVASLVLFAGSDQEWLKSYGRTLHPDSDGASHQQRLVLQYRRICMSTKRQRQTGFWEKMKCSFCWRTFGVCAILMC